VLAPDVYGETSKPGYNIFQPDSDIGWVRQDYQLLYLDLICSQWRRVTRNSTVLDEFEGISGEFDQPLQFCGGKFNITCHSLLYTYLEGYESISSYPLQHCSLVMSSIKVYYAGLGSSSKY